MDRASDSGSEGWGFESLPVCQLRNSQSCSVSRLAENCAGLRISSLSTRTRCAGLRVEGTRDGRCQSPHPASQRPPVILPKIILAFWQEL